MKKLLFVLSLAAACAASAQIKYGGYVDAMASEPGDPMAVEWHDANRAKADAATEESELAAIALDPERAEALLAQVKGAYDTDALVAVQIGAVTQWTMGPEPCFLRFWADSPAAGRAIWCDALLKHAEKATDDYVRMFCLDQLRWCAKPCMRERIALLAAKSDRKAVKDMVSIVLAEIR